MSARSPHERIHRGLRKPILLSVALAASALGLGSDPSRLVAATSHTPARAASHASSPHGSAHAKPHHEQPPPPEVALTPTITGASAQITMPPVGLSMEYSVIAQDLGAGPCGPPALASELLELGSPPLALAGDTQDSTAPSGALAGQPSSWEAATLYSLPASFWSQLHCLLSTARDPLTVGLNLKSGELAWAQAMVAGAQSAATNGLDFSLGNEPDLYYLPNYASLGKPQADEEAAAVALYLQLATYLQQALAGAPVIGPELARPAEWQRELPHVISQLHEQTVGVHMYPLDGCVTPKAVTVGGLLSEHSADAPRELAWVVADASAAGVPAIISEANSASCAGKSGVSDSPAAAVWAVRFVLSALKTGFDEVRFHFSGGPYDPFVVQGEDVTQRPLGIALAALNRWLPVGATLQSVAGVRGLVASRIGAPTGGTTLVLDDEQPKSQTVLLRGAASVHVEVLSAAQAGFQAAQLSATHGRIKLVVMPNSIVTVSALP